VRGGAGVDDRGMSENAANRSTGLTARLVTPILVIAAIAVVIVFDPLGELVRSLDIGSIGLPDLPGWIDWIRDLPGPGLLVVIVALIVLGEWGRREKRADGPGDTS
jgi:hypothetical protein